MVCIRYVCINGIKEDPKEWLNITGDIFVSKQFVYRNCTKQWKSDILFWGNWQNNVMLWICTTCRTVAYLKPLSSLWCNTGSYICTFTRIIESSYVQCWYDKWHKKCYKMTHIYLLISPNVFIRFTIIFKNYSHIFQADRFECQKVLYVRTNWYMYQYWASFLWTLFWS